MKQEVVKCEVEDELFFQKMEKVYLDNTKIELCYYGSSFFVLPFDSTWIDPQLKLHTPGKSHWFAIPYDVLDENELHTAGAYVKSTQTASNCNVLASILDFINDASFSTSVEKKHDTCMSALLKNIII
jgi:hypothetical protein